MEYITVKEAALKWNLKERSVQNYCANEKIRGAKQIGGQWFIPIDAKHPLDRRTKASKKEQTIDDYRFPVFIYSRYYQHKSELTDDEKCLLEAQILHFEGKNMKSLILCQSLLEKNIQVYLKAGVYLTSGIDSFLLGLVTKYEEMVNVLGNLVIQETEHKEDYLLINAALKFYVDWDSSHILEIHPSRLSSDAIWYYQTMILTITALSSTSTISNYYLKFWESECPFFEKEGMIPMQFFSLCGLGVLNDHNRTNEERQEFLNKGVKLAIDNNWISNLARFYNFSPENMDKIIKSYGDIYYHEIMKAHKKIIGNWNILHSRKIGSNYVDNFSPKQFELLLLISYGYTYNEISLCLGLSIEQTKLKIKNLMEISKTSNLNELRSFSRKFYDSSFNTSNE